MKLLKELQELIKEREFCKNRLEEYIEEADNINHTIRGPRELKGINYANERVQTNNRLGFQVALNRLSKINNHIFLHREQLKQFDELINTIASTLEFMDKIEYNVFIMRCVKGMKFVEIAENLGYSERQIYRYWKQIKI